ncbi:MAG: ferrochelatase, partial [Alphaproteobacteria bacterium]
MQLTELPSGHPPIRQPKIGVLLLNLGTPDGTDYWSMRRYLGEFLSDRRVIETSPLIWQPILQGIVLTTRPSKSGANYQRIWDQAENDSPLRVITKRQVKALQARMPEVIVEYGMRYGNPSTEAGVKALLDAGCQKILFAPLYPQYSATTTATANDKAFEALKKVRWQPSVRTLPSYFDTPEYIAALATSIQDGVAKLDFTPDIILTSYHGMPKQYLMAGDPYHCQCLKTTRLVREYLGWPTDKIRVTFQSRFGPTEWLQPYT